MTSFSGIHRVDPVDRAHLTGLSRPTPPIARYAPTPALAPLVQRYWIPVWSLSEPSRQSTLQHPACLVVISNSYARFYGVARGLSTVVLEGRGWAAGVMLTPGAGRLLLGRPVSEVTDRHLDLDRLDTLNGPALTGAVRAAMAVDPAAESSHRRAVEAYERTLSAFLPLDAAGERINEVIGWLAEHPGTTRVAELARAFGASERSLQRLVEERVGLTPKWLIQRRRLHDAVERLKAGTTSLADIAAELGYTDQAHFTRDFRTVSGQTPGQFLADQPTRR